MYQASLYEKLSIVLTFKVIKMTLRRNTQISSKPRQEEDRYNKIRLAIFFRYFLCYY